MRHYLIRQSFTSQPSPLLLFRPPCSFQAILAITSTFCPSQATLPPVGTRSCVSGHSRNRKRHARVATQTSLTNLSPVGLLWPCSLLPCPQCPTLVGVLVPLLRYYGPTRLACPGMAWDTPERTAMPYAGLVWHGSGLTGEWLLCAELLDLSTIDMQNSWRKTWRRFKGLAPFPPSAQPCRLHSGRQRNVTLEGNGAYHNP
jgi:hypothetical protein